MAGPKVEDAPSNSTRNSAKKSAKKRSRGSLATPANPSADKQSKSPKTPIRQRRRASEFASKKSSSKKRHRSLETPEKRSSKKSSKKSERDTAEDEESVDEILQQVRDMMESESTSAKAIALAEAMKKADVVFENDVSGSSSSEDEPAIEAKETTGEEEAPAGKSHVSKKANEAKRRHESSPRQKKKGSLESLSAKKGAQPKKGFSDSDDGSSDEDVDPARHKAEIEALKRDDPTFYKFLEENDGSLLDFDMSDESEEEQKTEVNRKNEEPLDSADEKGSDEDDTAEDKSQRDIVSGEDLQKETTTSARKSALGTDREKRTKKVNVGDTSESEEMSMSEQSDDHDDANTMTPNEATGHEMDGVEVASKSRKNDKSSGNVNDVTGYSDDDDDDDTEADAEVKAAAEAGLGLHDASDSDAAMLSDEEAPKGKRGKRREIFVDMKYLGELKELLKSKRSSLKACKDLLRLFRAGRDILPTSPVSKDKKAKQAMHGKKSKKAATDNSVPEVELEDTDLDVYRDDGSFTAGKVRFASAKCYQQAMNIAIIGIQDALDKMLGKPGRKQGAVEPLEITWNPTDSSRWVNLEQIFRPYVFHLLALCDATEDAETLRFLLRRLEKLVPYTRENKVLLKKISRVALHVWSSDPRHIGQTTRLRSYVLLARLAHGPGNAETVLRACCTCYSTKVGNVCNPKTLPLIHFATSCLVELFGVDMGASYTTAFSQLREMAVSLRAVLVSKDRKQEVERIHNWSYVNKLRLFSKILGRYGSEDELRPLIYPYVQISIGVMRAYPTPRTIPMRLHVASYLTDLTGATGVFIPVVPQLLSLLRCSELRKKGAHGTGSALEWRSLLRVPDETIKTRPFLTGVINGVVYNIAKFFAIISKHVSFPEVAHFAEITLKKTAKELVVSQWRASLNCLAEKIHETCNMISDARSKADFSPHGAIHPDGMLASVPGMDRERKMPIKRLFEVEDARVKKEERLRDEKQSEKKSEHEKEEGNGAMEEDDSSDSEETRPSKKLKTAKTKKQKKTRISLSVPQVNDSDDEGDEIAELSMDSDEESGSC